MARVGMTRRDYRLAILFALVIAVLFVLAETALLSVVKTAAYGNDPRVHLNGH